MKPYYDIDGEERLDQVQLALDLLVEWVEMMPSLQKGDPAYEWWVLGARSRERAREVLRENGNGPHA